LCFAASTTFASANNASVEKPNDPIKKAVVTTVNIPNTDPKKDECGNEIANPQYTCSITVGVETITVNAPTEGDCLRRLARIIIAW